MTLQELRYIVALADEGHFARAAEACHVGQPTLSTQLKKLEDYLGVTVFERNRHHLVPTPIGEKIIERARAALDVVSQIRELARQGHDPLDGPLRLGVIPTLGPYLIPHLLPAIRQHFPDLRLYLREDLTAKLLERMSQYRLDALLLALPVHGAEVETRELFHEAFLVALPKGHRLAARRQIGAAELAGENLLLLEEGHCLRDQALAICGPASVQERDELKATSLETLRQMVAAGAGCTLLPALAALPGVGSVGDDLVQLRAFDAPDAYRTIGLVWRRRYPRADTVRWLGELIAANLPAAVEPVGPRSAPRRTPRPAPVLTSA
ncbi:LysR substrate-binding domain-containing protein [Pseudothauera rhizosphaerae]|uniref:LysR family transcriptional regulator n=1 Tax=Pseudothauera rhizosphaerae TaxID=2565932 RepID=A0A4S4AC76_9RHOO|nr:LysR substrate-binding domain-containing protein [Pseudothauera rhizosphaerae]THF56246.1 LysR family transcriptional regulator [Pseudothauera rhizosphaerae]